MIKNILNNNDLFARVIYPDYNFEGIQFFTEDSFSQQVGYMQRDKGYRIQPHKHLKNTRNIDYTNEVLYIKSGLVEVDFYDINNIYFGTIELRPGMLILLIKGGHAFTFLEKSIIIEVKQGPFIGIVDKERFEDLEILNKKYL